MSVFRVNRPSANEFAKYIGYDKINNMKTIEYTISRMALRELNSECTLAIEAATIATSRFDERLLRAAPELSEGVRERGHMFEAQALIQLAGRSAGLEEMVLHDAGMDRKPATLDVLRGVSLMAERKAFARHKAEDVLTRASLHSLLSLPIIEPDVQTKARETMQPPAFKPALGRGVINPWDMPKSYDEESYDEESYGEALFDDAEDEEPLDEEPLGEEPLGDDDERVSAGFLQSAVFAEVDMLLVRSRRRPDEWRHLLPGTPPSRFILNDPEYDSEERLRQWQAAVEDVTGRGPAVLVTAIALDAWLLLEPAEHRGELGYSLAAIVLRAQGMVLAHLPALALGLQRSKFRWSPDQPSITRINGLLQAISEAARRGTADLQRLTLARDVMLRSCTGRSKNSRLPALVNLFISSPLVTVQLASKRLDVSPQAVEAMLKELGSSLPRELTGRKRYRAWGVL
jgi:Protein of unknown function (DUF1612)/HTH DNA binding domain